MPCLVLSSTFGWPSVLSSGSWIFLKFDLTWGTWVPSLDTRFLSTGEPRSRAHRAKESWVLAPPLPLLRKFLNLARLLGKQVSFLMSFQTLDLWIHFSVVGDVSEIHIIEMKWLLSLPSHSLLSWVYLLQKSVTWGKKSLTDTLWYSSYQKRFDRFFKKKVILSIWIRKKNVCNWIKVKIEICVFIQYLTSTMDQSLSCYR